jgi:hypothetical protein
MPHRLQLIPATKRNPANVYGICIVLAIAICAIAASGGGNLVDFSISGGLVAALLG